MKNNFSKASKKGGILNTGNSHPTVGGVLCNNSDTMHHTVKEKPNSLLEAGHKQGIFTEIMNKGFVLSPLPEMYSKSHKMKKHTQAKNKVSK